METILTIGLIVLVVVWIAFSPDKLASTLRARFQGAKARAADALDDAMDRVAAAEADIEARLAKARQALIEIKTMRKAIENKLSDAKERVRRYTTASENAASVNRRDLVEEAISRKTEATGEQGTLQKQLDFLVSKEAEVQKAVTSLEKSRASLLRDKVAIKTRAKTAKTTLSVNELMAGVDLTGQNKDLERAFELVEEVEAKSGAMGEIAEAATASQRMEEELEALSGPQVDEATEVEALMAKFAKTEETK